MGAGPGKQPQGQPSPAADGSKSINSAEDSGLAGPWKSVSGPLSSCFRMLPEILNYSYI